MPVWLFIFGTRTPLSDLSPWRGPDEKLTYSAVVSAAAAGGASAPSPSRGSRGRGGCGGTIALTRLPRRASVGGDRRCGSSLRGPVGSQHHDHVAAVLLRTGLDETEI